MRLYNSVLSHVTLMEEDNGKTGRSNIKRMGSWE